MKYVSTRGYDSKASASEAIRSGIAPDGGLYVPEYIPSLSREKIIGLYNANYQQIALSILEKFLPDFSRSELEGYINKAYNTDTFDTPLICPLYPLNNTTHILELWHGPTCAFKDLALQLLPHLLTAAAARLDDTSTMVILTATSGDTGKAALEGFKDIKGTKVVVFYPLDGVSEIQKLQMITQQGNNVSVVGVKGNFDQAQSGVKNIFADRFLIHLLKQYDFRMTSANSINWGRLVPQIVYYFSSYISLLKSSHIKFGDRINICIPTGNFGNIMAAYYAKKMGLPVNKLIIATNENDVLAKFMETGRYDANQELKTTISPSMDILVSSNFERLLFEVSDHNHQETSALMTQLKCTGSYEVSYKLLDKINDGFYAGCAAERATLSAIKDAFDKYGYVVDPHTAVALHVYGRYVRKTRDRSVTIIAGTASPYKFNRSVLTALLGPNASVGKSEFELLNLLAVTTHTLIPEKLKDLKGKQVLHNLSCSSGEMKEALKKILKVEK